jgi:phage protein D
MSAAPVQPGTPPQGSAPSLDDFYVPGYRVLLKGKQQPHLEQDIISLTYNDSLTAVDSVDIVVNNWDPGDPVNNKAVKGKFRYSDSPVFEPWQDIEIFMGYFRKGQDQLKLMLLGEIVTMAPTFPASGPSTLAVRALNLMHQFRTEQKTLIFKDQKDTEIAQKIIKDIAGDLKGKLANLKLEMDSKEVKANLEKEKKRPFIEMHHQYPIVFLMQRSRDIGYDLSIEDVSDQKTGTRTVTFHYRSSGDILRPVYTLEWGKSLISFQPTLQTAKQVNAVTVKGWNVQTKEPIEATATRAELSKADKVVAPEDLAVTETSLSQKLEVIVDRGFKDPKVAKDVALQTLRQIAQGLVEAKGKTIGLPDLRAGSKVEIKGLGRFDGIYAVTATTHTLGDGGYTTDFSARMEEKTKKPKGSPA